MLQITPDTLAAVGKPHEEAYLGRVIRNLRRDYPARAERTGPDRLREEARALVARGRRYGLVSEQDLYLFVGVGIRLGPTFDEDPRLPWASATLNSRVLGTPGERVDQLSRLTTAALTGEGRPTMARPETKG